jgi:hypothetical protein
VVHGKEVHVPVVLTVLKQLVPPVVVVQAIVTWTCQVGVVDVPSNRRCWKKAKNQIRTVELEVKIEEVDKFLH